MTDEFSLLEFFFSMVWFYLFIVWIFFLVTLIGDIFKSRDLSGIQKALWMVFLVFLPFIAAIAYLIARGDKLRERQVEAATEREEALRRRLNVPTSTADEISKLAALRDSGALTEEEFQQSKSRLVADS
ncbi:MAG TPA: SHOCT domain-containing protein [Nocardioides sp.]|nr:SHOCT domain-containing protein [Nocardioides sp.]